METCRLDVYDIMPDVEIPALSVSVFSIPTYSQELFMRMNVLDAKDRSNFMMIIIRTCGKEIHGDIETA
jgi:hypothetical protein